MGFEVELKFHVADPAELTSRLRDRAGAGEEPVEHEDIYFAHPARDFAQTGEAFRIRIEGDQNRITYKGSKQSGPTKTREEIEVDFAAGVTTRGDLRQVFERLGFTAVATVRKRRTSYHFGAQGRAMTVVVDEAEGLGDFVEVETLVATDGDLATAQQAVVDLAHELGLDQQEPRSYLRMLLESQGTINRNPAGQT